MSLLGETVAILGTIDPQDQGTTDKTSDWIDTAKYPQIAAYCSIGNLTGTMDVKLQQATDASGTSAKDITGAAITQLAATDDNKQVIISLDCAKNLDLANSFFFVACIMNVTGGTANLISCLMLGADARYAPVSGHDLSTVAEIVTL